MQRINVQRKHLAIHFKNKLKKVFLQKMVKRTCRQVTSESSYLGREFSVQHHQTIVVLFMGSLQELIQTHFINSGPWIMTYWINLIIMAIWPINFSNKYRSWSKEEVWSKDLFNIQTMPNIKINLIYSWRKFRTMILIWLAPTEIMSKISKLKKLRKYRILWSFFNPRNWRRVQSCTYQSARASDTRKNLRPRKNPEKMPKIRHRRRKNKKWIFIYEI